MQWGAPVTRHGGAPGWGPRASVAGSWDQVQLLVLGARPLPTDCLQKVGMVGARKEGCPTQVCSQGFCGPGWAWRGLWASLSSGCLSLCVDQTQCPKVSVASLCQACLHVGSSGSWGLTLGRGVCPPVF